jgi:hypothetical protein
VGRSFRICGWIGRSEGDAKITTTAVATYCHRAIPQARDSIHVLRHQNRRRIAPSAGAIRADGANPHPIIFRTRQTGQADAATLSARQIICPAGDFYPAGFSLRLFTTDSKPIVQRSTPALR